MADSLKIYIFLILFFTGCCNKSFKADEYENRVGDIDGVRLVSYSKCGKRVEFESERGKIDNKNFATFWNVSVNVYDKNVMKAVIRAELANIFSGKNNIELRNNVEVSINDKGKKVRLYTNSLDYINGGLFSKDKVRVEYPDRILEGAGVSISSDFSDIVVYKPKLVIER
jgi:hypothetical protein